MRHHLNGGWRRLALGLVLAAAAVAARAELFENPDGTVTDTASGLMWLKNANQAGRALSHEAARAWVQQLNQAAFAGHSDWRLPSGANPDGSVCNSQPAGANCTATEFATLYFARGIMAYRAGPFVNLQAGSYWTATEWPGDPTRAMAQDFNDGGQNPFVKTAELGVWAVRHAGPLVGLNELPLLHGIVTSGARAGALVRIDTQNGAVSVTGSTPFTEACGLTVDRLRMRALLSPCFGQAPLQVLDLATATTSPLGDPAGLGAIAHRPGDDRIYGADASPSLLSVAAASGTDRRLIGFIDKRSVAGLAVRPQDGRLFGIGIALDSRQKLFWLRPADTGGRRDRDVGTVGGAPLQGLAFHPDGRLFATTGQSLLTLDPSTGAVLNALPLQTAAVGSIGPIAFSGPRSTSTPDAWLRDCAQDDGHAPSACQAPWRSPDLIIDNDGNGRADRLQPNQANRVRITVRNRGPGFARGVLVRLYAVEPGTGGAAPIGPKARRVGQGQVDVAASDGEPAIVVLPWNPGSRPPPTVHGRGGPTRCLAVVLDHPSDRASAGADPRQDNNKAMRCFDR